MNHIFFNYYYYPYPIITTDWKSDGNSKSVGTLVLGVIIILILNNKNCYSSVMSLCFRRSRWCSVTVYRGSPPHSYREPRGERGFLGVYAKTAEMGPQPPLPFLWSSSSTDCSWCLSDCIIGSNRGQLKCEMKDKVFKGSVQWKKKNRMSKNGKGSRILQEVVEEQSSLFF